MTDGEDADCLLCVNQLVDDAVGAYAERVEAVEPPTEGMARVAIPLEQGERIADRVTQWPAELQQIAPCLAHEHDARHGSTP